VLRQIVKVCRLALTTLTQQEYNKGRRLGMPKRGYDKEEGL
jgi:hypothetical protein